MVNKKSNTNTILLSLIVVLLLGSVFVVKKEAKAPTKNNNKQENIIPQVLGNKNDLNYFSVKPGDKVYGNLNFSGSVSGGYFFEGNIIINILDLNKNKILQSYAMATTDWMTTEPVAFSGNIDLSNLPKGPAYIEIHNDNASGLSKNDKSILIPVIIK